MTDHIIKSSDGNTYDLTKLTTPIGMLPKDVQDAIRAWPHGVECQCDWHPAPRGDLASYSHWTYRCLPAPAVTEHVLWWKKDFGAVTVKRMSLYEGDCEDDTHRITIRYTGRTLPFGEYTGPDGAVFIVEEAE